MEIEISVTKWLESEFRSVQKQLESIKEQTAKTELKTNEIDKAMQLMVLSWTQHIHDSPSRDEVEKLKSKIEECKTELAEYGFIKKYYRVFAVSLAALVAGLLIGAVVITGKFDAIAKTAITTTTNIKEIKAEQNDNTKKEIKDILK